ncbi:MAG TPA: hypothetical protein VFM97_01765 [Gammaproteobacteria bacterium]|nr:hypothetical protein [Gammaproteobacteria bacterium]
MNKPIMLACLLLAALFCASAQAGITINGDSNLFSDGNHGVQLNDDGAVFHLDGKPDAHAANDGSVRIGGKTLALSDAQRSEVSDYVAHLRLLRDQALDVGLNAAHFALNTVWDATIGMLLHGKDAEDKIEHRADRFAKKVAAKVCKPIGVLHDEGLQLAQDIAKLKPYLPSLDTEAQCLKDASDHGNDNRVSA